MIKSQLRLPSKIRSLVALHQIARISLTGVLGLNLLPVIPSRTPAYRISVANSMQSSFTVRVKNMCMRWKSCQKFMVINKTIWTLINWMTKARMVMIMGLSSKSVQLKSSDCQEERCKWPSLTFSDKWWVWTMKSTWEVRKISWLLHIVICKSKDCQSPLGSNKGRFQAANLSQPRISTRPIIFLRGTKVYSSTLASSSSSSQTSIRIQGQLDSQLLKAKPRQMLIRVIKPWSRTKLARSRAMPRHAFSKSMNVSSLDPRLA